MWKRSVNTVWFSHASANLVTLIATLSLWQFFKINLGAALTIVVAEIWGFSFLTSFFAVCCVFRDALLLTLNFSK